MSWLSIFVDLWRQIKHHREFPRYHFKEDGSEKIDYRSIESAELAARRMERKSGKAFDAYRCPRCSGFHIGKR